MTNMFKRPTALIASLLAITALAGCMADTSDTAGTTSNESLEGKADGYMGRSALFKEIDPTAVEVHAFIGSPMQTLLDEWLVDAELLSRDEGACIVSEYATASGLLRHEACPRDVYDGEFIRFEATDPTRRDTFGRSWVAADFEGDGIADAFYDFADEGSARDDNRDGMVDWLSQPIATLDGFEVEGYPAGWSPPRELANRILEDTDFDGFFDLEGITGYDAWVCLWTGDAPEVDCEEPLDH